jgi:GAF domain-containing protein
VFEAIARRVVALCGGRNAIVLRFDGEMLYLAGHHGVSPEGLERNQRAFPRRPWRDYPTGRAFLDRSVVHVPDCQAAIKFVASTAQRAGSLLAVPLIRGQEAIGVIGVTRDLVGPFSSQQIEVLQTFADQAVIAIENVRLFNELQTRNADLTDALARQTATSEILRVISRSPTEVRPVFDAILESATRLCDAIFGGLASFDGERMHLEATHNWTPEAADVARRLFPAPPNRTTRAGRAILDRAVVHMPDVELDPEYRSTVRRAAGFRSILAVPMLRHGVPLGAIAVGRAEPGPFSDNQIALLKTFAAQAVIAIEKVRLFTELEEKNRALTQAHTQVTEALEQQTATSEILRVISSSPTDVNPVLEAIARRSVELCDAYFANVFLVEDEMVHWRASHNVPPEANAVMESTYPLPTNADEVIPEIVRERRLLVLEDGQRGDLAPHIVERARAIGHRSWVAVPLLREGSAIGVLAVSRREVKPFSDKQITLLQTSQIRPSSPSRTCGCSKSYR